MTPVQASPRSEREASVSRTVVETVAEAEGVDPTDLETRLYDVIDPDALDALFGRRESGPATEGSVSFRFHGYDVTVHSDSSVEIE